MGATCVSSSSRHGTWLASNLRCVQASLGAVPSPFECWMALRGMRTLDVRLRKQCASAQTLADFLEGHPSVAATHYPGLALHPQHAVARAQMSDEMYGGMLSFEVKDGTAETAMAVAARLRVIHRATSLGGTETLIEHRASAEPKGYPVSPPGLLRISVGLEDVNDLIEDLDIALTNANS
mmetsp:Transcript_38014/g.88450  ORF Transcript_38014/g.88450 Transcript_38014/m.88450 type:complete len:180 (-) Transcript_38014:231-770(-)